MSAIAGVIAWDGKTVGPALRRAVECLSRHGRDGEGIWDGGAVALGWRQTILHAEDRSDVQPRCGGGGRFRLVFDGRIDNREELAGHFRLAPDTARSWPDSAYVMAAFEKWGADCVPHLLGDYGFAVWDSVARTLTLVQDALGNRPLYYHCGPTRFLFATMPSALFSEIPRDIDDEIFYQRLLFLPGQPGTTIFRNVMRVPLGHAAVVTQTAVRLTRHWQPEHIPLLRYRRDEDYVEALRNLLDKSVRCRLRSIHPIGCMQSSGLDSCTVAAVAAQILAQDGRVLRSYTAVPPLGWKPSGKFNGLYDESALAAQLAQRYENILHKRVPSSGTFDLAVLDRYHDFHEFPRMGVFHHDWVEQLLRTAHGDGVRVMLTGGDGNRTISYDGLPRLSALARRGRFLSLATEWQELHRGRDRRSYRQLAMFSFGQFVPAMVWRLLRTWRGLPDPLVALRAGLNPDFMPIHQLQKLAWNYPLHPVRDYRIDDRVIRQICVTTPDFGQQWAGTLPAYDIDMRDPTADRRLLEFRAAVPERQFLDHGRSKWLLLRAMQDVLPPEILQQRHHIGKQAADWFDAVGASLPRLREDVEALSQNARVTALFDIEALRSCLTAWPRVSAELDSQTKLRLRQLIIALSMAHFMHRAINNGSI